MIAIEKSIPLPKEAVKAEYPFKRMEIGDSFFVEVQGGNLQAMAYRVNTAARMFRHRYGDVKFAVLKVDGGVRCWRIE